MKYIKRTIGPFVKMASKQFPVVLLTGPRQVGKTTFLKHLSQSENLKRTYITLDDPMIRNLAQEDPALFLQRFNGPLLIDELQYAPQLLPLIKIDVDNKLTPGKYWLTGSQQFHLMNNVSESLAGRVAIVNLLGFSQKELNSETESKPFLPQHEEYEAYSNSPAMTLTDLYYKIWRGSFPALYKENEIDNALFYASYAQTYLQRDVRDLANVGNETTFLRFLRACACRTGQLLNMTSLCRDSDICHNTGKRWLSILVASGLIYLLEPWHSNISKRLVKTPKLYFLDTGLAAYLMKWSTPETLEAGAMSGHILETWIVTEILKSYWHNGKEAPLFFYRDKDGKEVDLLINKDGTLFPIEIKKSTAPDKTSIRHFKTLNSLKMQIGSGAVICLCKHQLPLTENVQAIPVGML